MFLSPSSDDSAAARLVPMPRQLSSSIVTAPPRRLDALSVVSLLSARDRAMLELLFEHEVFTTDQLARVFFSRLDVAQRRLLRLTQLSVLDRFRWRLPSGSQPWHYVLGPIGATFVAARTGSDPPPPSKLRARTMRLAARPQLGHLLGLNGWFCDLVAETKRGGDARVTRWWSERRCTERFGAIVRPDAFATYAHGERRCDFFFEYDNGTEPLGRVAAKLVRYGDLRAAGGPPAPVLIWCTSARRERHLAEAIAKVQRAGFPARVVAATGSAEARVLLGTDLAAASWLMPGESTRRSLFDLAVLARARGNAGPNRAALDTDGAAVETNPDDDGRDADHAAPWER